tara:strand:+ start:47 stop:1357 length:1311 start_codon:yes stop_codon:yes gene_type:complete
MDNINLDITTYSIYEMENLLKLKPPYSDEDLFVTKTKLVRNILQSKITEVKKEELLIFLDNINNKLSNNLVKIDATNFNDIKQYDGNHFIIKNENNKYSSTLENNKKIDKSIIKRTYTIDSLFRQNYDANNNQSHNYIITLPETINKAITMSVSSLEIPLTYHNISDELNNNAFKITILDQSNNPIDISSSNSLIILSSGLYEVRYNTTESLNRAQNIVTEISNNLVSFNTDISNFGNLTFGIDSKSGFSLFQFNPSSNNFFDPSNYKVEIDFNVNNNQTNNQTNNQNISASCLQNKLHQKLGWQLGFRSNKLIINDTNKFHSISICYINYPRYLYIAIDDFQSTSRNYFSIASDSIIAPNIIGRINILSLLEEKSAYKQAAAPGDFMYNQKFLREYFGPTDINKLKISLLDEYGRPFSLNNMDWSFVLSFECFYN